MDRHLLAIDEVTQDVVELAERALVINPVLPICGGQRFAGMRMQEGKLARHGHRGARGRRNKAPGDHKAEPEEEAPATEPRRSAQHFLHQIPRNEVFAAPLVMPRRPRTMPQIESVSTCLNDWEILLPETIAPAKRPASIRPGPC